MSKSDIVKLEIFTILRDQLEEKKFAEIRIKYGEIIWMNTNLVESVVRHGCKDHPAGEYRQKLDIEKLSPNDFEKYEGKISHKINLKYPYDKDNLYTFITDEQLIELGLKEKPKRFRIKLNETQRWFISLCVALFIGIGNWYFDFLPTREKQLGDKHTDKTEYPAGKTIKQLDTLNLPQKGKIIQLKSDTLMLKYDSVQ